MLQVPPSFAPQGPQLPLVPKHPSFPRCLLSLTLPPPPPPLAPLPNLLPRPPLLPLQAGEVLQCEAMKLLGPLCKKQPAPTNACPSLHHPPAPHPPPHTHGPAPTPPLHFIAQVLLSARYDPCRNVHSRLRIPHVSQFEVHGKIIGRPDAVGGCLPELPLSGSLSRVLEGTVFNVVPRCGCPRQVWRTCAASWAARRTSIVRYLL